MNDLSTNTNDLAIMPPDASANALAVRSQREIEAALTIAAARPRNEVRAVERIQSAMRRPGMAADATYSFPRGGQTISGPSVVLARNLAANWGNMRWGVDELPTATGTIHLKGWAWDLETNSRVEAEDRFERLVPKNTGRRDAAGKKITEWVEPDERDLRELKGRRGAFLLRNCLLQLIPADIVEDAVTTARKTSAAAAAGELKARPQDTVRALVATFGEIGVTSSAIERRLGHALDELAPEELADLRSTYKAIRDGQTSVREAFPPAQQADTSKATAAAADVKERAAAALKSTPPAGESPVKEAEGENRGTAADSSDGGSLSLDGLFGDARGEAEDHG